MAPSVSFRYTLSLLEVMVWYVNRDGSQQRPNCGTCKALVCFFDLRNSGMQTKVVVHVVVVVMVVVVVGKRIHEVERASFTPLIFSVTGGAGPLTPPHC